MTLEWQVTCAAQPQAAWRQQVPVPPTPTRYRSALVIPAGCPWQQWRLWANGNDSPAAEPLWIGKLRLDRAH